MQNEGPKSATRWTSKTEAQRSKRRRREVRMEKEDGAKSRGCVKEPDLFPEL